MPFLYSAGFGPIGTRSAPTRRPNDALSPFRRDPFAGSTARWWSLRKARRNKPLVGMPRPTTPIATAAAARRLLRPRRMSQHRGRSPATAPRAPRSPPSAAAPTAPAGPEPTHARVSKGAGTLPNDQGQVWREYDITPYTQPHHQHQSSRAVDRRLDPPRDRLRSVALRSGRAALRESRYAPRLSHAADAGRRRRHRRSLRQHASG